MAAIRQPRSAREEFAPQGDASQRALVIATGIWVLIITWYAGGETTGGKWVFTVPALMVAMMVLPLHRAGHHVEWRWYLAPILLLLFLLIGQMNPSHIPTDDGGWRKAPGAIGWLPKTISPEISGPKIIPLVATYLAGATLLATRIPRVLVRRLWIGLVLNAVVLSIVGATVKFSGSYKFMGLITTRLDYFFATFTYRNHWAAYAVLMVAVAGGFMLSYWRRSTRDPREGEKARFFTVCVMMMAFTPLLPGSRSGSALMFGLVILLTVAVGWLFIKRSRRSSKKPIVLFGLIAIGFFAGALTLSWPSLEKRMEERGNFLSQAKALSNNLRVSFFSDTYDMAKARPVYGWGHGTYRQVFPRFQGDYLRHPSGRIAVTVDKAHNDWLQTWAEVGLVGLLALAVPPMIVLLRAWRSSGSTGRWALVGVGFVAIYALVDFPLRNYAIIAHLTVLICTARRTGASTG